MSSVDTRLLEVVSEAAFANPFSARRHDLDVRLLGRDDGSERPERVEEVLRHVRELLVRLEADEGPLQLGRYGERERTLLLHTVLFHVFHRWAYAFDAHIQAQMAEPDANPLAVSFAQEVLSALTSRGVSEDEALRYFAFFFQLRRAYYFINHTLSGSSPSMNRLRERLWDNVFTHDTRRHEAGLWKRMEDFSLFLVGETGAGKGTAAAAVGRSGWVGFDRRRGRFEESFTRLFVPVNLSQFPESLLESELFGHRKGAFTGASEHRDGVFGRCRAHGAIFLDELGEASTRVQIKLLNVLQERRYTPVGGREAHRFEGRIIAATNQPLDTLRESGRFRDDFYYRLCSDVVEVPPLRVRLSERPEVLGELLESIVTHVLGEPDAGLVKLAQNAILESLGPRYAWPGNVRELEQCVRRVILTGRCPRPSHTPNADVTVGGEPAALATALNSESLTARELLARYCAMLYERHGSYEAVARLVDLDRRTVRKYVLDE